MKNTFNRALLSLSISLSLGLVACGPPATTTGPNPSPSASPTASATASATPTPTATSSAAPTATPTATPTPAAADSYFSVKLLGNQEVPAVTTDAQGLATVALSADKNKATINVSVSGLSGPITGAHIHKGSAGSNGAVVKALEVEGNVLTGTWQKNDVEMPLTDALINDLMNGELYINVHTAANPNGEIRGQVTSTPDMLYPVYLSSEQEVPSVSMGGSGVALVRVRADQSTATLEGIMHNLSGEITGAHLHAGAMGTSGDVVRNLSVSGNMVSTTWKTTDSTQPLTDELLAKLKAGELYLNVHTAVYPNGEIRGQVNKNISMDIAAMHHFTGHLEGSNEVPAVATSATGYAKLSYDVQKKEAQIHVSVSGLSGMVTGAHIHKGAAGANGDIVKALTVDGTKLTGTWSMSDSEQPLTESLYADLLAGNLYVNVHTSANPGGEIRAQLMHNPNHKIYAVGLDGNQEVPPAATGATGTAWVALSPNHKQITVMGQAHGLSGPITGAHIHQGPAGLSGNVVKDLTVTGDSYSVTWNTGDVTQPLVVDLVKKLVAGELYINVHTAANPNGEVRGQIK